MDVCVQFQNKWFGSEIKRLVVRYFVSFSSQKKLGKTVADRVEEMAVIAVV